MGVAVFFMLSGYGNYFSIQKATSRLKWLTKRIILILVPFIFCFIYVTLAQILFFHYPVSWSYFSDFVSFSIPGTSNWYLKIQLLMYMLLLLSIMICWDQSHYVLCGLVILYICIAHGMKMDNYWYMTSLCFPLGYIIGKCKDKLLNILKSRPFFVLSGCLFVAAFMEYRVVGSTVLQIVYFLLLAIVAAVFLFCFGFSSKALSAAGKHSIYIYLIHIGMVMPCYSQINNIWLATGTYIFLVVIGTVICSMFSEPLNECILQCLLRTKKSEQ